MVGKSFRIVDESQASRVFLANHLHPKKFATLEASTGNECLTLAWQHEPDPVLFDPTIPDPRMGTASGASA